MFRGLESAPPVSAGRWYTRRPRGSGGYVGQPAGTFSLVRVVPDLPTGEDIDRTVLWYQENDVVAA